MVFKEYFLQNNLSEKKMRFEESNYFYYTIQLRVKNLKARDSDSRKLT